MHIVYQNVELSQIFKIINKDVVVISKKKKSLAFKIGQNFDMVLPKKEKKIYVMIFFFFSTWQKSATIETGLDDTDDQRD